MTAPTPIPPATDDGFTADLRSAEDAAFERFLAHPFLQGLRDGSLPAAQVIHYVGQDHQYLSAFVRCYGMGIAQSPDRSWMAWFHEQVRFLLEDEQHPHHVLCAAVGIAYADVRQEQLAPSAQAYVDHMAASARQGLGVLLSALLPCAWTYVWAATHVMATDPPAEDNPFRGWWEFYATQECQGIVADLRARVDHLAAGAGPDERARMARAFRLGCLHEERFWQMAWTLETWDPPPA